jgi:hypothetical protein
MKIKSGKRVRLSKNQEGLLAAFADDATTDYYKDVFTLRWAHLVTPRLDIRRLKRAVHTLTQRHDSLRLRFLPKNDLGWTGEIAPEHTNGVEVEDFGDVSDDTFLQLVKAKAGQTIDINDTCLFFVNVMRFGARGDVLVGRIHHAISDSFGAVLLNEELFKLMLGMPLEGHAISHSDFVNFEERNLAKHSKARDEFWEAYLLPLSAPPRIAKRPDGGEFLGGTRIREVVRADRVLDHTQYGRLTEHARANAISPYSLLFSAFADVLCERGKVESVVIANNVSRSDEKLRAFIGCAARNMPLKYSYASGRKLTESAQIVQRDVREAAAQIPSRTFFKGGRVWQAFSSKGWQRSQFTVHIQEAQGRMRSSDVSNVIQTSRHGRLSFGHIQLEWLDIGVHAHVYTELQLNVSESPQGPEVFLEGDVDGFSKSYIDAIATEVRRKLVEEISTK